MNRKSVHANFEKFWVSIFIKDDVFQNIYAPPYETDKGHLRSQENERQIDLEKMKIDASHTVKLVFQVIISKKS